MNLPQRVVLAMGFLLIAMSFLFPWSRYTIAEAGSTWERRLLPPSFDTVTTPLFFAARADSKSFKTSWILLQVFALGALTAAGYVTGGYWSAHTRRLLEDGGDSAATGKGVAS